METDQNEDYADLYKRLLQRQKEISENITETYNNLQNNPPPENHYENSHNAQLIDKKISIMEATRSQIIQSCDPLMFDLPKNFFEAITMLCQEIDDTGRSVIYKRATIDKIDADIKFYVNNTALLMESIDKFESNDNISCRTISKEQLAKAKDKFLEVKKDLQYVIDALYPNCKTLLANFLTNICDNHLTNTDTYIEVDRNVNSKILEILELSGIISAHPYQSRMYKMAL